MFSGYYKPRWELLIDHLMAAIEEGKDFDARKYDRAVREIDFAWTHSNELYPVKPTGDVVDVASRIEEEYSHYFENK